MNNMDPTTRAKNIVDRMYAHDAFSQWLGIELIDVQPGSSKIKMVVRNEMVNGFNIAHGGITYSLADSAFAFASNGYGLKCVSIETSISHHEAVKSGDTLIAYAEEIKKANRVGWYKVSIRNQEDVLVAAFKGTVYRTLKEWEI